MKFVLRKFYSRIKLTLFYNIFFLGRKTAALRHEAGCYLCIYRPGIRGVYKVKKLAIFSGWRSVALGTNKYP